MNEIEIYENQEIAKSEKSYELQISDVASYLSSLLRMLSTVTEVAQSSEAAVMSDSFTSTIKSLASNLPEPLNAMINIGDGVTKYVYELILDKYLETQNKEDTLLYYKEVLDEYPVYFSSNRNVRCSIDSTGVRVSALEFLAEVDTSAKGANLAKDEHVAELENTIQALDGDTGLLYLTQKMFDGKDVAQLADSLDKIADYEAQFALNSGILDEDDMSLGMESFDEAPLLLPVIDDMTIDMFEDSENEYDGMDLGDFETEAVGALQVWQETVQNDKPLSAVSELDFRNNSCKCEACGEISYFDSPILMAIIDKTSSPIVVVPDTRYVCQFCEARLLLPGSVLESFIQRVQQYLVMQGVKLTVLTEMSKYKTRGYTQLFTEYSIPHTVLLECFPEEAKYLLSKSTREFEENLDAYIAEFDEVIDVTEAIAHYKKMNSCAVKLVSTVNKFAVVACEACDMSYSALLASVRYAVIRLLTQMPFVALEAIAYKNAGIRSGRDGSEAVNNLLEDELRQVNTFNEMLLSKAYLIVSSVQVVPHLVMQPNEISQYVTESQRDLFDMLVSCAMLYQMDIPLLFQAFDPSGELSKLFYDERLRKRCRVVVEDVHCSPELKSKFFELLGHWSDKNMWSLSRMDIPEIADSLPVRKSDVSYCQFVYGDLFEDTLDDKYDKVLFGVGKCERLPGEAWEDYVKRVQSPDVERINSPYVRWFESDEAIKLYIDLLIRGSLVIYDDTRKFNMNSRRKSSVTSSQAASISCMLMLNNIVTPQTPAYLAKEASELMYDSVSTLRLYGDAVVSTIAWDEIDVSDTVLVDGNPGEYTLKKGVLTTCYDEVESVLLQNFRQDMSVSAYLEEVING